MIVTEMYFSMEQQYHIVYLPRTLYFGALVQSTEYVYVIGPSSTLGRTNREPGKNTARAEGPDGVSLSHSGGRFRLEFIGVRGRAFRAWEKPASF